METAVPACIVPEATRQAADSGTKAPGWSFTEKKNFSGTEAKSQRQFTPTFSTITYSFVFLIVFFCCV